MKPGRELDALVAEKVMGWNRLGRDGPSLFGTPPRHRTTDDLSGTGTGQWHVPRYSTDIAAAWEVVERLDMLGSDGPEGGLVLLRSGDVYMLQDEVGIHYESAPTAQHAICLAAIKAVVV